MFFYFLLSFRVSHAFSWKLLKPHMLVSVCIFSPILIQKIIHKNNNFLSFWFSANHTRHCVSLNVLYWKGWGVVEYRSPWIYKIKIWYFLKYIFIFFIIRICCLRLHNKSIDLKFITSYKFYILAAVSLAETGVDPVDNWSLLPPFSKFYSIRTTPQ